MKTVTVEVNGLDSMLSALGMRKQLTKLPGVTGVNCVVGSATATLDEMATIRDTVLLPPNANVTVAVDADNPGQWTFHCRHLYHMAAGMMTTFGYADG